MGGGGATPQLRSCPRWLRTPLPVERKGGPEGGRKMPPQCQPRLGRRLPGRCPWMVWGTQLGRLLMGGQGDIQPGPFVAAAGAWKGAQR